MSLSETNRELERAQDEMLALNAQIQRSARTRVLGEVVAGVAHELNNLLTVALGQTELLRRRANALPPAVMHGLERIQQSCDTASRIVHNALSTAASRPTPAWSSRCRRCRTASPISSDTIFGATASPSTAASTMTYRS